MPSRPNRSRPPCCPRPETRLQRVPIDGHVTAIGQLAFEAVIRAEREFLLLSITLGVGLAVRMRALSHGLLCIHEPVLPALILTSGPARSRVTGYCRAHPRRGRDLPLLPGNHR